MKTIAFLACIAALGLSAAETPAPAPELIAKTYTKTLTRMTGKPKSVAAEFAGMCRSVQEDDKFGPHSRHWVHHYRNDLAKAAAGPFPAGSVLIKEKMSTSKPDAETKVSGITGMIKLAKGTSPKTGDWQFFEFYDGKVATTRAEHCAGCHSGARQDHVFTHFPAK